MQLPEFHALFVLLLVGTQAFFTALAALNVRHAESAVDDRREWLESTLGVDDPGQIRRYHRLKTGFSHLRSWIALGVLLLALYAGLLERSVSALAATGWSPVVQGVAFFVGLVVAGRALSIPFGVVSTFVIEEIFDFNRQTPRRFVRDAGVSLVLSVGFAAVLGGAVLLLIEWAPTRWWVGGWLLFVAFALTMQILYPRVIAPLFNDFRPVESADLREAIETVFERAGFSTSAIYTMDASRRSTHLNAYFVGFGRTKRVVLFDTLVERMRLPEVQAVLAHELAHWKLAHIWKQLASGVVRMGIVFAALGFLVAFDPLYAMFAVPTEATYAGLFLATLVLGPLLELTAPLENRLSLKHEREADAFAADVMGDGGPMIDALARLATTNLANPFPHPWYAAFHYSHPPIPERIRLLEARTGNESAAGSDLGGEGATDSAPSGGD
ncbi:M48 family metallopeptidase [Haloferacaceae archaeon DSL9]